MGQCRALAANGRTAHATAAKLPRKNGTDLQPLDEALNEGTAALAYRDLSMTLEAATNAGTAAFA